MSNILNPLSNKGLMDEFADVHTPETYTGAYFDGKSSMRQYASLLIVGSHVSLLGENLSRRVRGSELELSEHSRHGALLVKFKGGALCELPQSVVLFNRLRMAGAQVPDLALGAHLLSGDWRLVALVLAFLVGVMVAAYAWLIPAAAQMAAPMIPESIKKSIGEQVLQTLDTRWFVRRQSATPPQLQDDIAARFAKLQSDYKKPIATLEFRQTQKDSQGKPVIGPNALTLPGGKIVLTDEMVELLKGDLDAISGVLAHELGHAAYDHPTTGVLKAAALTALGSAVIGDYSSVLAAAPAVVAQLKYGREAEAQADSFAFELMCSKRIDPSRTAQLFEEALKKEAKDGKGMPDFLRSHPSHGDRARFFRQKCPS